MHKVLKGLKCLLKSIVEDDFSGMAAEMAFIFVLAFFPFMIFLFSLFGLLGSDVSFNQILLFMNDFIPQETMTMIKTILDEILKDSSGRLVTIGFIIALYFASNATAVMMKGVNRAYNVVETRNFFQTRGLSIFLVLLNAFVLFLGVNLIIFGKVILNFIGGFITLPSMFISTVLFIRWPISFLALFTMAFLNYYFMPNIKGKKRLRFISSFPGTIFFCSFWLLASGIFSIYVNNLGTYNKVYGTLGAFAVFLLWLYYTSLIILIGGEINSKIYEYLTNKYFLSFKKD